MTVCSVQQTDPYVRTWVTSKQESGQDSEDSDEAKQCACGYNIDTRVHK